MRIGESSYYKYIHMNSLKDSAFGKRTLNNDTKKLKASDLSTNYNSVKNKDKSIDEQQKKAMKEIDDLKAHLKKSDSEIKKMRESADIQLKCNIIAGRIISGNKVPKSDYIYLAKNNSGLYQKAILLRTEREKPIKFKRISEYEKVKSSDIQSTYINDGKEQEKP